jgi:hypothetical protein
MRKYAPVAEVKNQIGLKGAEEYHALGVVNATKFAKEVLKIAEVDYGGNKTIANICNKALLALSKRKVSMPRAIRVAAEEFDPGSNHAAYYNGGFLDSPGEILINPRHEGWTNLKVIKQAAKDHEISTDDKHHLLMHEMGELARHQSVGWENYSIMREEYQEIEKPFKALDNVTKQIIVHEVSNYAIENHGEFVAEMFAAVHLGRRFDDDLLDLYTKFGGEKIRTYEQPSEQ